LADLLADTAARSMQWLRSQGARIIKVPIHNRSRWMLAPPRALSAGLDWKGRGPDVLLQTLTDNFKRRDGILMLGTRGRKLRLEDKRCIGITAEHRHSFDTDAACGLLADGGLPGH